MDKDALGSLLAVHVPLIIKEIMEQEGISEQEATANFYKSKLYMAFEDEATKLWHLSPKALYDLYKQEKENGEIIYPEET